MTTTDQQSRPLWERLTLRHVGVEARWYRRFRSLGFDDLAEERIRAITALGELLAHMRREYMREAITDDDA